MGITYRSASSLAGGTRTNSTVTAPAGIQDGDILICHIHNELAVDAVTPPTGWAEWNSSAHASPDFWGTTFWKRASGESGNYTFTHGSTWTAAGILCFPGAVSAGDPLDATFADNQGSSNAPVASAITNGQANSMNFVGITNFGTSISKTAGSSGYTVVVDADSIGMAYALQAASGSSGAKTFSLSVSDPWTTAHGSIKEPTAGVSTTVHNRIRTVKPRGKSRARRIS